MARFASIWLQQTHKDDAVLPQILPQTDLLAAVLVPDQLATLDKEILGAVPSGNLHWITPRCGDGKILEHFWPPQPEFADVKPKLTPPSP
ncbi:MAG TPA: hypothetical protein VE077_11630 [Candidatus Methylomirabilis sp.]|nr:hypothetical protein [Candidatus Methylomirabilis sp.]